MRPLVNLLPWRALQRQRRLRLRIGITGVVTLLLIGGFWGEWQWLHQQVLALQQQGDGLKSQHHRLQEVRHQQQGSERRNKQQQQGEAEEKRRQQRIAGWGERLLMLGKQLPEESRLHRVNWQSGTLRLEGYMADISLLEEVERLLVQLPGQFRVRAGPVSYQAAQGLNYSFILEETGGDLALP